MLPADSSHDSIYAHTKPCNTTREGRARKRARAQARLTLVQNQAPSPRLDLDRLAPIRSVLRTYREGREHLTSSPLEQHLAQVEAELGELEGWALGRAENERTSGASTRIALELLRTFGRITVLDYSVIPEEERTLLVTLLALEHRFCYAAAGTTRDDFKVAIGRTGAR